MVNAWVFAFVFTLFIEGVIYLSWPSLGWQRHSQTTKILDCFLIHCLTHPMVFFVFAWCFDSNTVTYLISAEIFAISVEAWWLSFRRYRYAFAISVVANLASWFLGGPLAKAVWTLFRQ